MKPKTLAAGLADAVRVVDGTEEQVKRVAAVSEYLENVGRELQRYAGSGDDVSLRFADEVLALVDDLLDF